MIVQLILILSMAAFSPLPATARKVPSTPEDVARPGGALPNSPKIEFIKVADGFYDPTNVTNAGDGSGRIFVAERVGRVKIVHKDGNVQKEPFLDLTKISLFHLFFCHKPLFRYGV